LIVLLFLTSCSGEKPPEKIASLSDINNVPESVWKTLEKKKTFFGHQSVGDDIIAGINDLLKENHQTRIRIVASKASTYFRSPVFAHYYVGKNTNPTSKINAFASYLKNGIGETVDIAFFKFCYVDINGQTNIDRLFTEYKNTLKYLKNDYPKTTYVHVTVPLTVTKTSIKTWIKLLMKQTYIWEYDDNIQRNKFNHLLREEYKAYDPIFDLATIESTFPNGKTCSFTRNGTVYHSLVPAYTTDGGHLNELGRRVIAGQLLLFLASITPQ
jgi:hypothetical protein